MKNNQYGFRKRIGTREKILTFGVLVEKQITRNKETYLTFIDIEKSFNSINYWKIMFTTLQEIGIQQKTFI